MSEHEAEPTCPRHPGTVAYVRCQRCDRPTCPECQRPAAVGILCVDCVKAQQQSVRQPVSVLGLPIAKGAAVATFTLIAINLVAFLALPALLGGTAYIGGQQGVIGDKAWLVTFGFYPDFAWSEPWRWITAGFVHDGVLHVGLNMFVLFMFGRLIEPVLGRARFLIVYFGSMIGGGVAIVLLGQGTGPHVGASGAIMGVIASYVIVASRLKQRVGFVIVQAGAWLVVGVLVPGVSWQGHLGGAAFGAAITWLILAIASRQRAGRLKKLSP